MSAGSIPGPYTSPHGGVQTKPPERGQVSDTHFHPTTFLCSHVLVVSEYGRPTPLDAQTDHQWCSSTWPHRSLQGLVLAQERFCCERGGGPCDWPVGAHADHHNGPSTGSQSATPTGWQCLSDTQAALNGPRPCSGDRPWQGKYWHLDQAPQNRPKTRVQHQCSSHGH